MKVDEFLDNRDPGDETKEPEFEHVTSLTPSGVEVLYSWAPKRLYRVRKISRSEQIFRKNPNSLPVDETLWVDVPSVTTVLGILDKSGALSWWAQGVAAEGVVQLHRLGDLVTETNGNGHSYLRCANNEMSTAAATKEEIVDLLVKRKISINHQRDKAADRGINVHGALESWCIDQTYRPNPDLYEEHERGYIVGLNKFLDDLGEVEDVEAEVMVGSIIHGFAGRYDLRFTLPEPRELVVRTYPKRSDKREVIPAGKYLPDLKSSKNVYATHAAQLAGYELASIECGYGATDYRAVIHVTQDGKYEFVRTHAKPEDFLSILQAYTTMQGAKSWL